MKTQLSGISQQPGSTMYSHPIAGGDMQMHMPAMAGTAYPIVMSSAPRFSMQSLPAGFIVQSNSPVYGPGPGSAFVPVAQPSGGLTHSHSHGSILKPANNLDTSPHSARCVSPMGRMSHGASGPEPPGQYDPQSQFTTRNVVQRTTRRPISPMPVVPLQQQHMPVGVLQAHPVMPMVSPHQGQVPLQAQYHMQQQLQPQVRQYSQMMPQPEPYYVASPMLAHQVQPSVRVPSQLSLVGHFAPVQRASSGIESPTATKQITERAYTVVPPNEPPMSVHEVTTREDTRHENGGRFQPSPPSPQQRDAAAENLEMRQRVQLLEEALRSLEKGAQDSLKELMDYEDVKEQLRRAQNRIRELEAVHENCERERESLRARIRQLEDAHQNCERNERSLRTRIRELEEDPTSGDLRKRNAELQRDLDDALRRLREAEDWEARLRSQEAQIEVLEREIDLLRQERDDAGGCVREMERHLTELRLELDTLREDQWTKIHERRALDKSLEPQQIRPPLAPSPPLPPEPSMPPSSRSDPLDSNLVPPHRPLASKRDPTYFAAEGSQRPGERGPESADPAKPSFYSDHRLGTPPSEHELSYERKQDLDDRYAGRPSQKYIEPAKHAMPPRRPGPRKSSGPGPASALYHSQSQHQRLPESPPPAALPAPPVRSPQADEYSMLHHSPKMNVYRGPDMYPANHELQYDMQCRNGPPQDAFLRPMRPMEPTNTESNRPLSVTALQSELSSTQHEFRLHRELQHGISRAKNALNKI
eukprot:GEMP01006332.1.p1 GENE.GEMP01006332.1~~GEMP01006332.1.p1  ORF type:complete len:759 (+),score=167.48 GEMP01006332.1:196-2472(+)